ncbi:MAG: MATE family efflux transporter [Lachnospiraceae bacterium]|nr:MATE family efflux transporter [Lachnospiraceae bacterium]
MRDYTVDNKKNMVDFTEGNPTKLILAFFWPLLVTSLLQQFYNFADTWIVGRGLGDNALAAVGNMGSLFFLLVGFSFGLANGFGILVAQSYGAKDYETLRHRMAAIIELGVVMTAFLTFVSVMLLPVALKLMQTDELIIGDSLKYGYIVFGGMCTAICFNIAGSVLRAFGDSTTPLKAIVISSVINILLDVFFIFGIHTGVEGAAIATLCSQAISSVICINRLRKIPLIHLKNKDFKNEIKVFTELLKNGLPMAFMNSITALGCMVVQYFVNGFGVVYTAAYAACGKYLNLFMNPAATAGSAITAYAGQNYGAGEYRRIKDGIRVCVGIAVISYILLGSVLVFMPEVLGRFLLSGEEQIALLCDYLPRCGVMLIFVDILFIYRSALQGMGKPMLPMISGILEMFIRASVILFFAERIGFMATAYAEIGAWIGAMLLNAFAFYRELNPLLYAEKDRNYRIVIHRQK